MRKSQGYTRSGTRNAAVNTRHVFLIIRADFVSNSYLDNTTMSSTVNITGTFVIQIELLEKTTFARCYNEVYWVATV